MKKLQRLLCLLLCLVFCLALLPAAALAEDADEDVGTITLVEDPEQAAFDAAPAAPDEPNAGDVAINETNFPDAKFRAFVQQYDTDSDGSLSSAELGVRTMGCANENIADLTGIEHFTELRSLSCNYNQLTSLDLSNNTALTRLSCDNNQLTSLDVSQNTALSMLTCGRNQLTSLDVSRNTALTWLSCESNYLTSLDLSVVPALKDAVENGTKDSSASSWDKYSSSQGTLYVDKTVTIITDRYGFRIAGIEVTPENQSDVLGNGAFSYDTETKTLTVHKDYSVGYDYDPIIDNYGCDGLVITTDGNVSLSGGFTVIRLAKDTTFTGGRLNVSTLHAVLGHTVEVTDGAAVTVWDADLLVQVALERDLGPVTPSGIPTVIYGGNWLIDNSALRVTSRDLNDTGYAIEVLLVDHIEMQNGYFANPYSPYHYAAPQRISDDGTRILWTEGDIPEVTDLDIRPGEPPEVLPVYGFYVDSKEVNEHNLTDILGNGIFSFDGDHTLSVAGDYEAGTNQFDVTNGIPRIYHKMIENAACDGLVIDLAQASVFTGAQRKYLYAAMYLNDEPAPGLKLGADTEITGAGLTMDWVAMRVVDDYEPYYSTVEVDAGVQLTIRDTAFTDASDPERVVYSLQGAEGSKLVIDHSAVTLSSGASGFTGGIELIGCKIVYPEGGRISDDGASIVNADGSKAAHVVIEPVASSAGQCGDELYWSIDIDSGKLTFSGTGDMWDFTVETVPWADSRSQIVSVEIPEGVTGIGDYAFTQCAFSSVTIPDSVTRIGEGAFVSCKAESVTIPAGVTSIGKQAFYDCRLLSAFFVDEANASYSAVDGVLFSKDGTTLIVAPIAHSYDVYAIPAGVTRIEDFAFASCGDMDGVEFPASLTEIGQAAFWSCGKLTSVCFPQNLSAIGTVAFSGCTALAEIRFLGHAPTFGTYAFRNVRANAYYPAADETWTEEVRQNYGGTLTWLPFDFYLPDGYYLIGPDGWEVVNVDPNEKFVLNTAIAEYVLTTTLTAGDPVKVVEVEDSAITTWYPDGLGNEYVVDAAHAGKVNIYFKPTYSSAWADFGGYIWIEADHEHSPAEAVQENYTEPTCTVEGGYDSVVYCSVCGAELSREHVVLSALGHLPGVPVEENYAEPTATEEGGYDMVTYCQRCDVELSREHTVLPATLDGFYLIVSQELIDTGSDANYQESNKFAPNPENEGEYILTTTLALRDHVRVCNVYCGSVSSWYPSSQGNDYQVDADHAGEVTVYFKPTYDSAWADFGGYIWIEKAAAEKYGLRINGVEVTEDHLAGTAYSRWSFDADHTLSILGDINGEDFEYWNDDHTAGYYTVEIIENYGLDGLVVDFANHAKLKASYSSHFYDFPPVITASKDTVITGAGGGECLATGSGGYEGPGISVKDGVTLTIRDTELTVKSDYNAAILGEGSGTKLVVNNASLDAVGKTGSNAIQGFTGGIELIGCEIVYPEGGRISADGKSIVNADGSVASHVVIEPVKPVNPFTDVAEGKYYYIPVLWAYYHDPQITGGISDTEFGPNKTCTREQIVTFLWKAMGAPEPETTVNPFEDVKSTKYYYKAVLWAVENEVTGGMDATHFGVGKPCTREQAMTFLWKAMGSPEPTTTENPFEDVPSTKYYYKPVLWAVENGITSGVDATHFGVGKSCTRGQIVTFLYKAIVG